MPPPSALLALRPIIDSVPDIGEAVLTPASLSRDVPTEQVANRAVANPAVANLEIATDDTAGQLTASEPARLIDRMAAARPANPTLFNGLIRREAQRHGIPSELVDGVVSVESAYNPIAVGGVGELGLMQIRPETARMLGFNGPTTDLLEPETNIRYAATYLAGAWRRANGDLCRTLMKYRAGHAEERMSSLSVEYCLRVRDRLRELGSPLAAAIIPVADFVSLTPLSRLGAVGSASRRTDARSGSGRLSRELSAYILGNRTPQYRAMLAGRS